MIEGWLAKCELHGYFNNLLKRPVDPMNESPTYEQQFYMEDTVKMGRALGRSSNKLNVICEEYEIELEHHNALSDVLATKEIYYIFKNELTSKGLLV